MRMHASNRKGLSRWLRLAACLLPAPWMIGFAQASHEVDLSYPPAGVEAPVIQVDKGERNTGVELSPEQARWREKHYGETHRVIDSEFRDFIPEPADGPKPSDTKGGNANTQTPAGNHQSRAPPGHAVASAYHGRLWQITSPRLASSHLFATAHLEDPRILKLPPAVEQAFNHSRSLTLEIALDEVSPQAVREAMLLADGATLASVAGAELTRQVVTRLAERGVPEAMARQLKPWAAAVMLSTPPPRTGMFLDRMLLTRARAEKMPVSGLETAREQFDVLDRLTQPDQLAFLRESLKTQDAIPGLIEQMVTLYLAGDLEGLATLSSQHEPSNARLSQTVMERLVYARNRTMAQRMRKHIDAGGAFIAIGALHLPGSQGVIELLRAEGYEVRAVY